LATEESPRYCKLNYLALSLSFPRLIPVPYQRALDALGGGIADTGLGLGLAVVG